MALDDVIKRMKARVEGDFSDGDPGNLDDMKLGIEALKRIQAQRKDMFRGEWKYLPGETET